MPNVFTHTTTHVEHHYQPTFGNDACGACPFPRMHQIHLPEQKFLWSFGMLGTYTTAPTRELIAEEIADRVTKEKMRQNWRARSDPNASWNLPK